MPSKYIGSLTAMRGLAALWVMLFHIDVSLVYRDMGALLPRDATGLISKGYLWVDFFFILSGFIIAHVYAEVLVSREPGRGRRVLDYLWARLARLYPLHLLCLGLVVAIALTYPLFLPDVKDGSWRTFMAWRAIPSNLMMTHAMNQHVYLSWDIVSWSIGAEWWTYSAALPLLLVLPRAPGPVAGVVAIAAFAGLAGYVLMQKEATLDITYRWGFVRCLLEFIIGACLWRLWCQEAFAWLGHDLVLLGALIAVAVVFHFKSFGPGGDLIVVPLFVILVYGLAVSQGVIAETLNGPLPQYFGKISYALYLVHGVAFSAFWFLMPTVRAHMGEPSGLLRWLYAAGFIVLVVPVSHVVHYAFEKPARLFLLSLRKEKPRGAV